jgi:hypothetical protein
MQAADCGFRCVFAGFGDGPGKERTDGWTGVDYRGGFGKNAIMAGLESIIVADLVRGISYLQ